jgi:hypothetical protein
VIAGQGNDAPSIFFSSNTKWPLLWFNRVVKYGQECQYVGQVKDINDRAKRHIQFDRFTFNKKEG